MEKMFWLSMSIHRASGHPPFGHQIDYLTFVASTAKFSAHRPWHFLETFCQTQRCPQRSSPRRGLLLQAFGTIAWAAQLEVALRDGEHVLSGRYNERSVSGSIRRTVVHSLRMETRDAIKLWDLSHPNLYTVHVSLKTGAQSWIRTSAPSASAMLNSPITASS